VIVAKQLIEQVTSRWTDERDVRVLDSVLADLTALGTAEKVPDNAAMRARVQLVVDTINKCQGTGIPQSEVDGAMATDEGLLAFAHRYGQSLDWLVYGDVGGMIMVRAEAAGWNRREAS
jgi:hypothetical protein